MSCFQPQGGGDKGQLIGVAQPKDLFSLVTRSTITAPDFSSTPFDPTGLTTFTTSDAAYLWVGADCDTAGATLGFCLATWSQAPDGTYQFMGLTQGYTIATGSTYRIGARYPAVGAPVYLDLLGAAKAALVVTSVSAGSWSLFGKPF